MDTKKIRLSLGYTQGEFAKELGLTLQCVSNWETGIRKPSPSSIKKIIRFCKINDIKM